MPLARTPPQKGSVSKRPHTFGPLDAFPDGTPLPPDLATPLPGASASLTASHRSQPDPTPTRGPSLKSSMLAPAPLLQPLDERVEQDEDEEMEIEKGLLEERMDVDPEPAPTAAPATQAGPQSRPQTPPPRAAPRQSQVSQPTQRQSSQPQFQPKSQSVEPTTPRRRSRRQTIDPDSPPTHIHPPPNAFSTPKRVVDEDEDEQTTPGRLTRARTPAGTSVEQLLATPAVPIDDGDESRYGRYYEALVRPLRIQTLDQGLGKLTVAQMAQCYPMIADESPDGLRAAWESMLNQVRKETLEGAYDLFNQYRVARRLQYFADVVDDGLRWKEAHPGEGRMDGWRPDLKPQVLSTAANLAIYDESWRVLREEYLVLAEQCGDRLRRVEEKRARLAALDNGVSEAVLELEKTNALFEDFPTTSMLEWAEDVGSE